MFAGKRALFIIAFILGQTILFFAANLFYFYQEHSPHYKYWEAITAFMLFLCPTSLALYYFKKAFPKFLLKNFWIKVLSANTIAFIMLLGHIIAFHTIHISVGKKRFEKRFFQCMPYAPWPAQTHIGQFLAQKIFQIAPISWQYSWYTFEDICRMENLRSSFIPFKKHTPHYCIEKEKHSCLVNTLENLTAHTPLGTAGVVLAQDLLKEVRDLERKTEENHIEIELAVLDKSIQHQERARQQLQVLYRHLTRILNSSEWISKAGMLATIEFQTNHFPSRAVASISEQGKKYLTHNLIGQSSSNLGGLFNLITGPPNQKWQEYAKVTANTWNSARLKLVDHYIRNEIFKSSQSTIGIEGVATLRAMQYILVHSSLSDNEKTSYTKDIQKLTQRYGF